MMFRKYSSGGQWEDLVGYSRAVLAGNILEISGTVSVKDGKAYAPGDPYLQTRRILEIAGEALAHFGARYEHVIRTRIYVTDFAHWEEIGRAHAEIFGKIKPASTMVEVSNLISEEYVVEIEFTACIPSGE